MNAFGASVVLLLSAANARRHSAESAREETRRACRCNLEVLCKECREQGKRRRHSDDYKVYGACFRD
jgi:hypothetical protein